jgi:hypothetical protein
MVTCPECGSGSVVVAATGLRDAMCATCGATFEPAPPGDSGTGASNSEVAEAVLADLVARHRGKVTQWRILPDGVMEVQVSLPRELPAESSTASPHVLIAADLGVRMLHSAAEVRRQRLETKRLLASALALMERQHQLLADAGSLAAGLRARQPFLAAP